MHIVDTSSDICSFTHEIAGYSTMTELDEAMLHRLINKIIIGEKQIVDDEKIQKVRIEYNFAGEI